ncbi:tetratricopeptide repeat protein [Geobacter sp. DSM 9736]|uniref:tetratricopeptide repeat protein n=1 Tax=Geobacter sp. DSM 9736 TaxID=1277350 RepID=UPI000B503328|nr:tetratricopeptide repeat protein [Geobacter sp. DSM 9736]SNB46211.1 hypothetical protein SAMN06269301_1655 [Geobacter sp. DSM 9736]
MTVSEGGRDWLQYLVIILFSVLLVLFSMTRYADYDLWWHLKLGESVFETGKPFFTDTFSYTFAGKSQYCGEWIADLLIFLSYHTGGIAGVNLLKALVLSGTFFFLYRTMRDAEPDSRAGFAAAIITLVTVLFAIRFRLFVRPYLFSLLFTALFLFILGRSRHAGNQKLLFLLPIFQVFWANMSVGAVFGPVIFFLFAVDRAVRDRSGIRTNVLVLVGLLAATMVNPETWRIWTLTLDLSSDPYKALVGEYQPMSPEILWGFGLKYTLAFQILAFVSALYFVAMRGWRNIYLLLLYLLFLVESVLQIRMVEFFALVAAPAFATVVRTALVAVVTRIPGAEKWANVFVAGAIVLVVPLSVLGNTTYVLGADVKEDAFPEEALQFLDREQVTGTMFNSYSLGGYIIWRAPERKVFFDGRYRRLYNPAFYGSYTDIVESAAAWKAAEERYGFDYAVVEYDMLSKRFPLHLNDNPQWALVYWDNHSAVYLKRTPARERLIAAGEYRVAKPNFYDFKYLDRFRGPAATDALAQINREIALNPANQEPVLARVFLLYSMGPLYHEMALRDLEAIRLLKPDLAMEHSARAFLLMARGREGEAREAVKHALSLDPLDPGALELGNKLGMKLKLPRGIHH